MTRHLNISPFTGETTHALLRLEAPAQRQGGWMSKRGFQLAGELFLLTSFFIEPEVYGSAKSFLFGSADKGQFDHSLKRR